VRIEWKLKNVLENSGVSVYALARAMGNQTHAVKLYRITSPNPDKRPRRIDFDTLEQIIPALSNLTGGTVTPNDLLEVIEETNLDPDQAWLDASAADLAAHLADLEKDVPPEELKAWNKAFEKQAAPVVYDTKRRVWLSGDAASKYSNRKVVTR
jgi:hypothetical protein